MSAERDSQLGLTFNFTNFYYLYRQEKLAKGIVLKAEALSSIDHSALPQAATVHVISEAHTQEMKSWTHLEQNQGKKDLVNQIRTLRQARKRLHFLMNEVDQVLKKS